MQNIFFSFKDKASETHYQEQNMINRYKIFNSFLILQILFLSIMFLIIVISEPTNYDHCVYFFSATLFLIVIRILKNRSPKIFRMGLNFSFLFIGVLFTEFANLVKENNSYAGSIAMIIPIQSFCTLILLTRLNWIISSVFYMLNLVYFLLRMLDIDDYWDNPIIWLGFFMGVINFTSLAYKEEKGYRGIFKENYDSHRRLDLFHILLRNVLPSNIFILNYDKESLFDVEFLNNNAMKLMNKLLEREKTVINQHTDNENKEKFIAGKTLDFKKVEDFFKKFKIVESRYDIYQENIGIMLKDYFEGKIKGSMSPSYRDECHLESIDFMTLNLYRNCSERDICDSDTIFNNTEGGVLPKTNFNKFYEMKISKIPWGDSQCLLILLSDITKSKRIIELKNLDNYKNQLLASISHDLRTPLNGVIGMVNTAISQTNDEKIKDFLIIALRSANLLDFLIKDILDFSQISYKKLRLNLESFKLDALIDEVLNIMHFQAINRLIDLRYEGNYPKEMNVIHSDANRIKQILINLIGNAIKFTKQGYVKLKVETMNFPIMNYEEILKFSVEDSGIGIKPENTSKLFTLFGKLEQEDPEINKHGIGLGLAISDNLAKLLCNSTNNGLHVESIYGEGSTFWFYIDTNKTGLKSCKSDQIIDNSCKSFDRTDWTIQSFDNNHSPNHVNFHNIHHNSMFSSHIKPISSFNDLPKLLNHDNMYIPSLDIHHKPSSFTLNNHNNIDKHDAVILLVDDDMINLYVLEKYLDAFNGVKTIRAMHGAEAVDIVKLEYIDQNANLILILMDCNMPIMDGYEATEIIIKEIDKKGLKKVPIIGISAGDSDAEIEKGIKAGMMRLMVKPVRKDEFINQIKTFIKS